MATRATVRQQQCAALLCAQGYMPSGASALVGNFSQECGNNINCQWRHGRLDHGSQGLAQWRLKRLEDYEEWARSKLGYNGNAGIYSEETLWAAYGRLDLQCEYVAIEMKRDYPKLHDALCKGGSVSALTAEICWQYERPSKIAADLVNRTTQALAVFNTIPGGASHAHDTDLRAAMDQAADTHAKVAAQGGATAAAGGVLGTMGLVAHFAQSFAWYEWVLIGLVAFLIVTGVIAMIVGGSKAQLIRNAKAQVDPERAQKPAAPEAAREITASSLTPASDPSKEAKTAEDAAIDAAMKKTGEKSAPRHPLMSIHSSEKQS